VKVRKGGGANVGRKVGQICADFSEVRRLDVAHRRKPPKMKLYRRYHEACSGPGAIGRRTKCRLC
jgi:hypothetical protein